MAANNIKLVSKEGEEFSVPEDEILMSQLIKNMVDLNIGKGDNTIKLETVSSKVLKKVLEFTKYRKENPPPAKDADDDDDFDDDEEGKEKDKDRDWEFSEWEEKYMEITREELFDLIMAANYLDMKELLDLGCKGVAYSMRGKTAEQLREMFGVENDWPSPKAGDVKAEPKA